MGPCPVRAPPVIAPGALTGFSCRAPENNSKVIFFLPVIILNQRVQLGGSTSYQGSGSPPCRDEKWKTRDRDQTNHDSQRHDRFLRFFLRLEIGQFSPHFGAMSLLNYTGNLEKREKIHWRKFKKFQWRRRPEIADFCPLSWSNVSWRKEL